MPSFESDMPSNNRSPFSFTDKDMEDILFGIGQGMSSSESGFVRGFGTAMAATTGQKIRKREKDEAKAEREKEIEMGRDDLAGKKEEMKEKIVAGRIGKRLKEMALMDQAYIKDSTMTVEEMVKQVAGKVGENIQVRRFVRFTLGEGIEVEKMDFAAEVAAMGKA